ncbi:MAG: type 2 isopentenyl-diphosphate Delta-isomerase [Fervidicoccaceae archaeon]
MGTAERKLDHIIIALSDDVEAGDTLFGEVNLIHRSLPEMSLHEVDTSTSFLGKRLSSPLMITGMTGGHHAAGEINRNLARIAEELKIAIGVGSQRAALENSELAWTYKVVREEARSVPVIANIGAQQLGNRAVEIAERAVEMIEADALAIHLNPAQEVFQSEGDTDLRGILEKIEKVVDSLQVPIIVKETGSGMSRETVSMLAGAGVKIFDISGAGGTNWVKVEIIRRKKKGERIEIPGIQEIASWGIPTAISILEARSVSEDLFIIASGGIRSGLDVAKSLALGADLAGFALPALKAVAFSDKELRDLVSGYIYLLKRVMFLVGARSIGDLKKVPVVLGPKILSWLSQREISVSSRSYNENVNFIGKKHKMEGKKLD